MCVCPLNLYKQKGGYKTRHYHVCHPELNLVNQMF